MLEKLIKVRPAASARRLGSRVEGKCGKRSGGRPGGTRPMILTPTRSRFRNLTISAASTIARSAACIRGNSLGDNTSEARVASPRARVGKWVRCILDKNSARRRNDATGRDRETKDFANLPEF